MLTPSDLTALRRSLRDEHVLSVFVDRSASDPAEQRAWRTALDNRFAVLRDGLQGSSGGVGPDGWRRWMGRIHHRRRYAGVQSAHYRDADLRDVEPGSLARPLSGKYQKGSLDRRHRRLSPHRDSRLSQWSS
jgi:hypothetical protein